jgi:oxalate decarboxylase/phosphoglucose isomerase-like protein (cupin superfamily)
MGKEGIPVHYDIAGFSTILELPRGPWHRTEGSACFIETLGTNQAEVGMYVADIPPRQEITPQHHLYPELIVVLKGRGSTQLWQRKGGATRTFEWGEGSAFLIPHNAWYRLFNGSAEPVIYLGITKAPALFNVLYDPNVIFNCDAVFSDLYDLEAEADFYSRSVEHRLGTTQRVHWETNFIPDVTRFALAPDLEKVADGGMAAFWMDHQWPNGHISRWGVGTYHKAHWHGPGAILIGLSGSGYVLLWPRELGTHPYADGRGDSVAMIEWEKYSLYVPYDGAYHQHFNTSPAPALHLAIRNSGERGQYRDFGGFETSPFLMTTRKGGTLIEYEDEDPEIRRRFEEALKRNGVECKMPLVRRRPF